MVLILLVINELVHHLILREALVLEVLLLLHELLLIKDLAVQLRIHILVLASVYLLKLGLL